MSTFSLQLLDFPGNYEKGTVPYGPRTYVAIKSCSIVPWRNKSGKKKIDFETLSHECLSMGEFESEVDRLIKELETIKRQAKRFFNKDEEKKKSEFSKRT